MRRLLIMLILIAMTPACAKRARVQLPGSIPNPGVVMASAEGAEVDGRASYYGDPYHGRATANGETFDKNKMTAAHRTLPFNTWVRVENQLNGKKVDVRINDRGPFVGGRLIDLSEGAAREIDMIRSGVAPVRLLVIKVAPSATGGRSITEDVFYVVQLGAFENEQGAQDLRRRFERKYTGIYVDRPTNDSPLYKVRIGRSLLREARFVQDLLKREDEVDAIVVQMN
jgi:rare lipoprotein A